MMSEKVLFVPVTCASCRRVSVVALSKSLVRSQLHSGAAIDLCCVYDDIGWKASPDERTRVTKLLQESERMAGSRWLRLRGHATSELHT